MNYSIWNGEFARPIEREYRVSLCVTCMGRREDLAKTLPVNLELNASYPNVEFLVLDYNSRDGLEEWIRREMRPHLASGRLIYCRTEEPQFYSMTHSRNIAFKLATGDIVCNVDADNYTLDLALPEENRPPECFASYLNRLANQQGARAIFAKGRRLFRGRLGFFRRDFLDLLGGYDEDLEGYGHDDRDLVERAWAQGFTLFYFGGRYYSRLGTSGSQKIENMKVKNWRFTQNRNKEISARKLALQQFRANDGRDWGRARVRKNFEEWVEV